MEKLGVFGGTFNPIHNGHLSLCAQLADAISIPRVLLIPTAIPPHKQAPDLLDGETRLAMCRLAAAQDERFIPCDIELRRKGSSYTADTLCELEGIYPDTDFFLFMGSDMFLTVQNWYRADEIFRRAILVAGARKEGEEQALRSHLEKLEKLGAKGQVIRCRPFEVSSTQVRQARAEGRPVDHLVPRAVAAFLEENRLYEKKEGADGNG